VEQPPDKGFSFAVGRIRDLREALAGAEVRTPRAVGVGRVLKGGAVEQVINKGASIRFGRNQ
jgi:hypothetical protein